MALTIGHRWPRTRPYGDYPAECAFCGTLWPRSKLRRDADGLLYCPQEGDKPCAGELDAGNLQGRLVAAQRSASRGRVPDGIVRPPLEVYRVVVASPESGDSFASTDTLTVTGTCSEELTEVRFAFAHPRLEPGRDYLGTTTPADGAFSFSVALTAWPGARTLWTYGVSGSRFVLALPVKVVVTNA